MGEGFHLIDWQQHNIIAWMFMARYGTREVSKVLHIGPHIYDGGGSTPSSPELGSSNSLGMTDTKIGSEFHSSYMYTNFLGLEGIFTSFREYMEGVVRFYDKSDNTTKIAMLDKGYYYDIPEFYEHVSEYPNARIYPYSEEINNSGEVGSVYLKTAGDLLGISVVNHWYPIWFSHCNFIHGDKDYAVPMARSGNAGLIDYYLIEMRRNSSPGPDMNNLASRLAFDGNITVVDDVEEFKSIPYMDYINGPLT